MYIYICVCLYYVYIYIYRERHTYKYIDQYKSGFPRVGTPGAKRRDLLGMGRPPQGQTVKDRPKGPCTGRLIAYPFLRVPNVMGIGS